MSLDFNTLLEMAKWDIPKDAKVEGDGKSVEIVLSDEFRKTFPHYAQLLSKAFVKEFTVDGDPFRFYEWKDKGGTSIVWLADMGLESGKPTENESPVSVDEIVKEHLLLLQNAGGILSTWDESEEEEFLTWAKNFVFGLHRSFKLTHPESVYNEDGWIYQHVEESKKLPISNFICFSEEANGNLTFYDKTNAKVYLLLGDHCFDYVEEVDGHPEYSFYTIKGIDTFIEYTELLAKQTLSCIKAK